ncbi:MAG: hypothetical protein ABSG67_15715 [Thermoguttaceae bacterium]
MKRFILNKVMCGLSAAAITMAGGSRLALAGQADKFFPHAGSSMQGSSSYATHSSAAMTIASTNQLNLNAQQQAQRKFISGYPNPNSGNVKTIARNNSQIPGTIISKAAKSATAEKVMSIKSANLADVNNNSLAVKTLAINNPGKVTSNKIASKLDVKKLDKVVDLNKLTMDKSNSIKDMSKRDVASKLASGLSGKVTLYGKPVDSTTDPGDKDPPEPGANNVTATDTPTTGTGVAYDTPTTYGQKPIKSHIDFSKVGQAANLARFFPSTDPKPNGGYATDDPPQHGLVPLPLHPFFPPWHPFPQPDGPGPNNIPATDWQIWTWNNTPIFGGCGGYGGNCGTWNVGYNSYPDADINAVSAVVDEEPVQTAPEAIPESVPAIKIAIINPEDTGITFKFRLNGEIKSLPDGNRMELTDAAGQIIEFNRGKSLGSARYALNEGVYTLNATEKGWELIHSDYAPVEE